MSLIRFTDLGLKEKKEVKTFKIGDFEIEVLQYLPIRDKYDLVACVTQKAISTDGKEIFNPFKLDAHFHLYLVMMYTNIDFSYQELDTAELYDILDTNGIIDEVVDLIPESEYKFLYNTIQEYCEMKMKYGNTAGVVLRSLVADLPAQAGALKEITETFDTEKFTNITQLANKVGMDNR